MQFETVEGDNYTLRLVVQWDERQSLFGSGARQVKIALVVYAAKVSELLRLTQHHKNVYRGNAHT